MLSMWAMAQFGAACGSDVTVLSGSAGAGGSTSVGAGAGDPVSVSASISGSGPTSTATGGPPEFTDCNTSSECSLVAQTCCGVCDMPQIGDMTAINNKYAQDYNLFVCGDPPPPCPGCAAFPNPNLYAYCDSLGVGEGNCVAADVRKNEIGACTKDAECQLRFGLECCESCVGNPDDLVAINIKNGQWLSKQVCDPDHFGCPDCAPQYPPGAKALCVKGSCFVDQPVPGG